MGTVHDDDEGGGVAQSDLSYSIASLQGLGVSLNAVADVMERRDARAQYEPDDVGHRDVHAALEHFQRNWDDRRELLVRSVREVADAASQSASLFSEADDTLAQKVASIMRPA